MEKVEQPLATTVMEHPAEKLEHRVRVAQSVTVRKVEYFVINLRRDGFAVENHAAFLLQIAVSPDVVVSREEMDVYPHVRQF